jgi:cellobiose-specific phosphotransferase system component IIA
MVEADIDSILSKLDEAYEELRAARTRLAELLPMSATKPGDSGQARVEFVTGLEIPSGTHQTGEDSIRQINAEAWEAAQQALINAQEKVELAHRALRSQLSQ